MATEIKMPPLSQTTDTVTLIDWLVKEGDTVEKGQPIAEVETDKVNMQVECFTSGTIIKLVSSAGDEIPVGDIMAYIGKEGEKMSGNADSTDSTAHAPAGKAAVQTGPGNDGLKATPLVLNFAAKKGVDLSLISGTGPKGMIVKADVVRFIERGDAEAPAPAEAKIKQGAAAVSEFTETLLMQNQQAVARHLTKSFQEIPHYYLKTTVYMDTALLWRDRNRTPAGEKVSIYTLYIYAAAQALRSSPGVNGFFKNNSHCIYKDINVAFAVSSGQDLFVPVVKQADRKSILEIDREVRWLTAKAQNGKLEAEDITGGTFTVSNLGVYQVDEFAAIITPGQAGIAAIGRTGRQITVDDANRMQIRQGTVVTGSFDHRIINGAGGAAFLEGMKAILEKEIGNG